MRVFAFGIALRGKVEGARKMKCQGFWPKDPGTGFGRIFRRALYTHPQAAHNYVTRMSFVHSPLCNVESPSLAGL